MEAWMHYTPEGLTFLTVENPDFDRLRVNLQGYRKQRVIPLPFISANSLDQDLLHYIQAARDLKVPLYFVFVIPQDQGFFLNGSTIGLYKEALQTFFRWLGTNGQSIQGIFLDIEPQCKSIPAADQGPTSGPGVLPGG
jgi:hypothetical protein